MPTPGAALRQLMVLRAIAVIGQGLAIGASVSLGVSLPVMPMVTIVIGLVTLNALMWLRLRVPGDPGQLEVAANLALDLMAFTLLLYLSGGIDNPFHEFFVLHGVLIALLLPARVAIAGVAVVVLCYVALLRSNLPPLALAGAGELPDQIRSLGDALAFVLTAAITAWFVIRIIRELREKDRLLSEAAQRALRDEAVMRVGALAAGAAHELGTPLTTMSVIANEIAREGDTSKVRADAALLGSQIEICRRTLDDLMHAAGHGGATGGGRERLDRFLDSIASQCAAMHPEARIVSDWSRIAPPPQILSERGLRQALLCLLNNAVEASPDDVRFSAARRGDAFEFCIRDRGRGLNVRDLAELGKPFFTTKPPGRGIGLGLVLATRAVERLGGTVSWANEIGRGVRAQVTVPALALQLEVAA